MGLFDSLKDTAAKAAEKAKESASKATEQAKAKIDEFQENRATQNAERAEKERFAKEKASEYQKSKTDEILNGKSSDKKGIFQINSMEDTLKFTQEYMKKLVLPASSLKSSKLNMNPYTDEKVARRDVIKKFGEISDSEKILFTLNNSTKKEYLAVSTSYLYALISLPEFSGYHYSIKISLDDITEITFNTIESTHQILCNGTVIMELPKELRDSDFVNLRYYFECLEKSDFEITDEEIDELIHEKIGNEAYNDAHKYMDEDEKIIYFAWGLDSLTAKDFLMCTTQRFVMLDREMFGMAENVKNFYYEDINSMSIQQENAGSLTVTLLNAAMKLCDLIIHTAGTSLKIETLSVTEANRVIEIYNQFKKAAREEAKKPIVVQAQEKQIDPLEQIQKLQKLKEAGIITEDEFNTKKADLLSKI